MKNILFSATLLLSATLLPMLEANNLIVSTAGDTAVYTGGSGSNDNGDLRYCLNRVNNFAGPHTITFQLPSGSETILLGGILPIINQAGTNIAINGSNIAGSGTAVTVDGGSTYPGFPFRRGFINLSNMTIANTVSQGGNGGPGGGGGAGSGGAILINNANVTISNLTFINNQAKGGNGTSPNTAGGGGGLFGGSGGTGTSAAGGGGGGLGGKGGNAIGSLSAGGGGGGGIAPGANTPSAPPGAYGGDGAAGSTAANKGDDGGLSNALAGGNGGGAGGNGGLTAGGGGGGGNNGNTSNGRGGGGGGDKGSSAGNTGNGASGNFGGGGGGAGANGNGGNGGGAGGGGGSSSGTGGSGGDGGGGGAGSIAGGNGGFGGGGGAGTAFGTGGAGGGNGNATTGGGGGGFGGAIFIDTTKGNGVLTVAGPISIINPSVTAGTGANTGAAVADNIFFIATGSTNPIVFNLGAADVVSINGVIGDDSSLTLLPSQTYQQGTTGPFWAGVNKTGPGTLVYNGNNTYAGLTDVMGGELQINGSIASDAIVRAAALISGIGRVGGNLTIQSGGIIKPGIGNSIGILSVTGDYEHDSGAYYIVEFNGLGQSSRINVHGSASLGGGIVVAQPLSLPPSTNPYLILHADSGVNGQFDGAISTAVSLIPSLIYDSNNVYLVFSVNFPTQTCNQLGVATALTTISAASFPSAIDQIILSAIFGLPTAESVFDTLTQLSGEQYTNILTATELNGQQFLRRLYDPLRPIVTSRPCCDYSCCCSPTMDLWLEASGGQSFFDNSHTCHGMKMDSWEVTAGAQSTFNYDWTLGAAGSYIHDHAHYNLSGCSNNNTGFFALYGLYRPQDFYFLADVAFGYTEDKVKRPIHITNFTLNTSSKPKIYQGLAYGEVGLDLCLPDCCVIIQPFGGIEVSTYRRCRINEHGADILDLSIDARSRTNVFTRLGFHLTTTEFSCTSFSLDLAWQHRLTSTKNDFKQHFQAFGPTFNIFGNSLARDSIDGAVTVTTNLRNNWQLYVEASGQVWSHVSTYNALAGIQFKW